MAQTDRYSIPLAILGGAPRFGQPLPVGQLYFPKWEDYERSFRGIFDRQYYTNQGPLTEQLEGALALRLHVRHALCVTNATIGLSMVAEALGLQGQRVIVPSFTFIATAQSLVWSNVEPRFCDIDPTNHHLDLKQLEKLLQEEASAILAVNLWGGAHEMERLESLAQRFGVPLYFDSAHGFGCITQGRPLGGFGRAEVFSFHATKVMSAGEGGCITTNDDQLAERLRNIRSSYGVRAQVPVFRTANGRMSEAQAAIGLLSLEMIDTIFDNNRILHERYRHELRDVAGLRIMMPLNVEFSNHQYLICEIDAQRFGLTRDQLHAVLQKENVIARRYFKPGAHRCPPFAQKWPQYIEALPETDRLCERVLQLPLGSRTDGESVSRICTLIRTAQQCSDRIRTQLA